MASETPSFVTLADGSVWPHPTRVDDVTQTLMSGTPTNGDIAYVVAALYAYIRLVGFPESASEVCGEILERSEWSE